MNAVLLLSLAGLLSGPSDEAVVRVLTPEGAPLERARITAWVERPEAPEFQRARDRALTDDDGIARLQLGSREGARLTIQHRLYGYFGADLDPRSDEPVELRFPRPPWKFVDVQGRVLSLHDDPLRSITIRITKGWETHDPYVWTAVTNEDGWFEMRGVAEGSHRLEYFEFGSEPLVEKVAIQDGVDPLALRLRSFKRVVGFVSADFELELERISVTARPAANEELNDCDPSSWPDDYVFWHSIRGEFEGNRYQVRLPTGRRRISVASGRYGLEQPWIASAKVDLTDNDKPIVRLDLKAEGRCP